MVDYERVDEKDVKELANLIIKKSENGKVIELAEGIKRVEDGGFEYIADQIVEKAVEKEHHTLGIVYFDGYIDNPTDINGDEGKQFHSIIKESVKRKVVGKRAKFHRSGSDNHDPIEAYGTKYIGISLEGE